MAKTTKYFKNEQALATWLDGGMLPSGVLAVVLDETGDGVAQIQTSTNNIDGKYETYEVEKSTTQPLQAVGYMFGDYVGMPMYEMGNGEDYPCDYLTITTNEDGFVNYQGYIYIKYNRLLTDEEVEIEKTKITGDVIKSNNIVVEQMQGMFLEIKWNILDDNLTIDTMYINYDGSAICSFSNELYTQYCDTGVIMMGSTSPITQENWNKHLEVGDIITNDISTTLYPVGETGEYHIMIMTQDYQRINFPIEIYFNHGTEKIEQYPLSPQKTFVNNGLRCYVFDFQGIPTPSQIDTIGISWGNAFYVMKFV